VTLIKFKGENYDGQNKSKYRDAVHSSARLDMNSIYHLDMISISIVVLQKLQMTWKLEVKTSLMLVVEQLIS
jgi:hypothetical protein